MEQTFKISSSPHVRDERTTTGLMADVIIALMPATVFGIYNFGYHALFLVLTCIVSCVLFEWGCQVVLKRKVTVKDCSAIVTGLLLALNLSPDVPVWMAILGSAFAIIIVKQLFGGLGQNFMNPALGARCFLLISFAGQMTSFTYDGVTSATPLAELKANGVSAVNLLDMFKGTIPGTIGETSVICILVGGVYLIAKRVISPVIPLMYIGTFAVLISVYSAANGGFDPAYLAAHLCGGGLMLGAFFMATDYVTSPITKGGKYIFGALLGLLTFLFRIFGGSAEGVSYSIIFANLLVPLIEKVTMPKSFGQGAELLKAEGSQAGSSKRIDKKSIAIAVVAILIITCVAGFALGYVYDITKEPIAQAEQNAKEEAYKAVFKDADSFEEVDCSDAAEVLKTAGYDSDVIDEAVAAKDASGENIGYVFLITSNEAYGGSLQLAMGITSDGTVNGISFLSLSETAGLGMEADKDTFKDQFAGKKVDEFKYTKSGAAADDEIDALSGATITTNAVTNAVNSGISYFKSLEGGNN